MREEIYALSIRPHKGGRLQLTVHTWNEGDETLKLDDSLDILKLNDALERYVGSASVHRVFNELFVVIELSASYTDTQRRTESGQEDHPQGRTEQ